MRKSIPSGIAAITILGVLLPATLARAVETQTRSYRTSQDFSTGEMDHVSVSPLGRVVLSPDYQRLADLDEPVAWALARIGSDLLIGTGHEGRVLRLGTGAGARPTVFFDSPELEVTALSSDSQGTVWIGTSPDGRVYRALPGARAEPFFDPEERYIWALLPAADGSLVVATGDKGAIYRVAANGVSTPLLAAEETHVLSLALAKDGTLYAGSGGNGYVYKVEPGGKTTVLLDTAGSEVKAVTLDSDGNLWAASTGRPTASIESAPNYGEPLAPPITVTSGEDSSPSSVDDARARPGIPTQAPAPTPAPTPAPAAPAPILAPAISFPISMPMSGSRQSWLYRIRPNGLPEEIWRTGSETVHSMALLGRQIVLGTGEDGKLFAVDTVSGEDSILLDLPGAQVTALLVRDGGLAVATSNLASIWGVSKNLAPEGRYDSSVIDAGHFATWGRIEARGIGPIQISTRSGNTEKPAGRWSAWEEATAGKVRSPQGRYLQYRVKLSAPTGDGRVELREIEMSFLPHNLAPRLRQITVMDPHIELLSSAPTPPGLAAASGRSLPPTRNRTHSVGGEIKVAPREQETYGARSARWDAEDPNGDGLMFSVSYRGEGESTWRTLSTDLNEAFVAFDATAFADGIYEMRVVATDQASNPEDRALSAEIISEPFVIDNTSPVIVVGDARVAEGKVRVRVSIADRASGLRWAEASLDGGPWKPLLPEDQVFDEREEAVDIVLPAGAPGEHSILLRAGDAARNVGSGNARYQH